MKKGGGGGGVIVFSSVLFSGNVEIERKVSTCNLLLFAFNNMMRDKAQQSKGTGRWYNYEIENIVETVEVRERKREIERGREIQRDESECM